jgi:archaellum component FlaC
LEGLTGELIQAGPQDYQETRSNPGTKEPDSIQSLTSTNTRDIQMAKGKHKNISNRSQNMWASSETISPTTAIPEYTNTLENQESLLKSYLMKIIEPFKKDINNLLKEIQKGTSKQVKELNKAVYDLKVEVENTNGGKSKNGKPRKGQELQM